MRAIRRFLDSLRVIDAVMVAASIGGGLWLVMVYLAAMNHGPALMLAVLASVAAFARLRLHRSPTSNTTPVSQKDT